LADQGGEKGKGPFGEIYEKNERKIGEKGRREISIKCRLRSKREEETAADSKGENLEFPNKEGKEAHSPGNFLTNEIQNLRQKGRKANTLAVEQTFISRGST